MREIIRDLNNVSTNAMAVDKQVNHLKFQLLRQV